MKSNEAAGFPTSISLMNETSTNSAVRSDISDCLLILLQQVPEGREQ